MICYLWSRHPVSGTFEAGPEIAFDPLSLWSMLDAQVEDFDLSVYRPDVVRPPQIDLRVRKLRSSNHVLLSWHIWNPRGNTTGSRVFPQHNRRRLNRWILLWLQRELAALKEES